MDLKAIVERDKLDGLELVGYGLAGIDLRMALGES
jgi:hypothetical protein